MKIDRSAWAAAYNFHKEALEKQSTIDRESFWEWMGAKMLEISNTNGNGALIMALLIAVYEDVEAVDKAERQTPAPVIGA